MIVPVLIAALALVQSLFGVGLLLFGTPTLLLLGYSFQQALATLLPASITVSALQVWRAGGQPRKFAAAFVGWCLLPLAVALWLVLAGWVTINLNLTVAIMLTVFVALRVQSRTAERLTALSARYERPWMVVMGIVHGVSNLGGAILLTFAASRYSRKEDIRALVAFCYLSLVAVQLAVLAATVPSAFSAAQLVNALVAGTVFMLAGDRTFQWLPRRGFDALLTGICGVYAILLGLRSAGWW
jgi:hypothetical protein